MAPGVFRRRARYVPSRGLPWLGTAVASTNPGVTNLAAWWSYSETTDVARVDSHGAYDLTPSGAPSYRTGKIGNAADFDKSVPQYVGRASHDSALSSSGGFTYAGWVYLDDAASDMLIAGQYGTSIADSGWKLWSNNGVPTLTVTDGSAARSAAWSGGDVSGGWHFIDCGYDPSGADVIWVNVDGGTPVTTSTSGYSPQESAKPFRSGTLANGSSQPLDGALDEHLMYSGRVLTAAELLWLRNGTTGRAYSELDGAGDGEFSASGGATATGGASVGALGALDVAGVAGTSSSAALSALGALEVDSSASATATAALSARGSLGAAAVALGAGSAELSGLGTLTVAGSSTAHGVASFEPDDDLDAHGAAASTAGASLSARGFITVGGRAAGLFRADLTGVGALAATGHASGLAAADLSALATITAGGSGGLAGWVSFATYGALAAAGSAAAWGAVTLADAEPVYPPRAPRLRRSGSRGLRVSGGLRLRLGR